MRIIGHGIDIVETARIANLIEQHPRRFLDRCFTDAERAYAEGRRRRVEHLAARFAAKEAVFKALGTGLTAGIRWTDAEVVRQPAGQPILALHGQASEIASRQGIEQWCLSLSHTSEHAIASVIAWGLEGSEGKRLRQDCRGHHEAT